MHYTQVRRNTRLVNEFNEDHPVGIPVRYWTMVREGMGKVSRTRTPAQLNSACEPVVWVDGYSSYVGLTHVQPVKPLRVVMFGVPSSELATCSVKAPKTNDELLVSLVLDTPMSIILAKRQAAGCNPFLTELHIDCGPDGALDVAAAIWRLWPNAERVIVAHERLYCFTKEACSAWRGSFRGDIHNRFDVVLGYDAEGSDAEPGGPS